MRHRRIDQKTVFDDPKDRDLREAVLAAVRSSTQGLRTQELLKENRLGSDRNRIRRALAELVETQQLTYAYHHGCSYIQRAWDRPVRISRRVTVKPPGVTGPSEPEAIVIDITPGAAFGWGDHPTTTLSVQAIEFCTDQRGHWPRQSLALDVGTGTGVLAMVSVCMGIERVVAIDIDPCAIAEAKSNATANGLSSRIEVTEQSVEQLCAAFDLITANLRFPTLSRLAPLFEVRMKPGADLVVSGLRSEETEPLRDTCVSLRLRPVWHRQERGWAAMAFQKETKGTSQQPSARPSTCSPFR
jgi:ribosomal protein L11 methyltransferase